LEKFYTRRKSKVADVADNQNESVYNFPVEVEVERPTNTFKQGSNKYFRSSYSEKAKLPVISGSSGWQGQQPAMGRPHDQVVNVLMPLYFVEIVSIHNRSRSYCFQVHPVTC